MKLFVLFVLMLLSCMYAAPAPARIFLPPVIIDKSKSVGGDGGAGGDAAVVGVAIEGGVGGDGVDDSKFVFNKGKIAGGDGSIDATAGNGAVGFVKGKGAIIGSVANTAVAGDGGDGGKAIS
eukprot:TRINITY_DN323_c0_g1_i3.p2 TRINITY_DN323_c0_g1~~TRINITY_DN323_c0_g1_i3.p2  ORF type:complete len:122 (-),score=32.67 TRINITY_DN323_c0_g1_i3:165-530(-)